MTFGGDDSQTWFGARERLLTVDDVLALNAAGALRDKSATVRLSRDWLVFRNSVHDRHEWTP